MSSPNSDVMSMRIWNTFSVGTSSAPLEPDMGCHSVHMLPSEDVLRETSRPVPSGASPSTLRPVKASGFRSSMKGLVT